MSRILVLLAVLGVGACTKAGHEQVSSEVLGCDDGGEPGSGDGSVGYALSSGCGDGGSADVGTVGPVDPGKPREGLGGTGQQDAVDGEEDAGAEEDGEFCLTDQCNYKSYKSKLDKRYKDNPTLGLSPDLAEKVEEILGRTDLTDEQKGEALSDLIKSQLERRATSDQIPLPGVGQSVVDLYNISSAQGGYENGVAINYSYSDREKGSVETTKTDTESQVRKLFTDFLVRIGVKGESGLPGALGAVTGQKASVYGDAEVSAGAHGDVSITSQTTTKDTTITPKQPAHVTTIEICYPNGEKKTYHRLVDTQASVSFSLGEDGAHAAAHDHIDRDTDAINKKREADRQAERAARENRLQEAREAELQAWANAKIVYYISGLDGEWVEVDATFTNSYNYIYDYYPQMLGGLENRRTLATNALSSAVEASKVQHAKIKEALSALLTQVESPAASTSDLRALDRQVSEAKSQLCPEKKIGEEVRSLSKILTEWDDQKLTFERHIGVIQSVVDATILKTFLNDRDKTFNFSRDMLASIPDPNSDLCAQFDRLHWPIALALDSRKVQQVDQEAKDLSDEALAGLKQAAHDAVLADLTAKLDVEIGRLAEALAEQRLNSHITEAEAIAQLINERLSEGMAAEIDQTAELSDADRVTLKARLRSRADSEISRLQTDLAGSGARTLVYSRMRQVNSKLARLRQSLAQIPSVQRESLLSHWIGIVSSSGPRFSSACVTVAGAASPECWKFSATLNGASGSALRVIDEHMSELEVGMTTLEGLMTGI